MVDDVLVEHWIEVAVDLPDHEQIQAYVASMLYGTGADSLIEQDATTLGGERIGVGRKRLVTYVTAKHAARVSDLRAALRDFANAEGVHITVEVGQLQDADWRHGWKAWFRPAMVSPRLGVRAPWAELDVPDKAHVLVIEPGLAFGTGLHETTRLCLRAIDRVAGEAPPSSVLDVGCGSGVLSIAAAKLGVGLVVGVDVDPIAVEVAMDNAQANAVACSFSTTPVERVRGQFPVVVANILSHVLFSLREALVARTRSDGLLIVSGLLTSEADALIDHFTSSDAFDLLHHARLGEWSCLELVRRRDRSA